MCFLVVYVSIPASPPLQDELQFCMSLPVRVCVGLQWLYIKLVLGAVDYKHAEVVFLLQASGLQKKSGLEKIT